MRLKDRIIVRLTVELSWRWTRQRFKVCFADLAEKSHQSVGQVRRELKKQWSPKMRDIAIEMLREYRFIK